MACGWLDGVGWMGSGRAKVGWGRAALTILNY